MTFLSRLERKFGRFAVANVTLLLIAGQVAVYIAHWLDAQRGGGLDLFERMALIPALVLKGEVWRLVSFVFIPPFHNVIAAFFFWYVFYFCGTVLEQVWGTFRYNIYLFVGYLATVGVAFLEPNFPTSNYFLKTTVFLAFARLNPEFVFYIYYVLPVKARWLAIITWLYLAYTFLVAQTWIERAFVVASVANYMLFFGPAVWRDVKHGHRRTQFQARTMRTGRLVHTCAVCGLTSDEAPQAQFRYCSKCDGDVCYCPDHLRDHEHVVRHAEAVGERRA